jgi:flagellin
MHKSFATGDGVSTNVDIAGLGLESAGTAVTGTSSAFWNTLDSFNPDTGTGSALYTGEDGLVMTSPIEVGAHLFYGNGTEKIDSGIVVTSVGQYDSNSDTQTILFSGYTASVDAAMVDYETNLGHDATITIQNSGLGLVAAYDGGSTTGKIDPADIHDTDGYLIALTAGAVDAISSTTIMAAVQANIANRADLGAQQNRLSYIVDNMQTLSNNLADAQSRIVDTNYAAETANLTRGQILQQAATSMLAQANQMPNVILTLLK